MEEHMKLGIIAFSLLTTVTAGASSNEKILKQVDALLAQDNYENAFHCQDQATMRDNNCWDGQCSEFKNYNEVTSCGAVTTIRQSAEGDDEVTEQVVTKQEYIQSKGNPLRMFSGEKFTDSGIEWTGVESIKVQYLGAKRNAIKVKGTVEVCMEESEVAGEENKSEECFRGPMSVTIVQGVPFLARISNLTLNLDGFSVNQNLVEFSRKE